MLKFKKFEDEIVGNNIEDFFFPEQIRENNSELSLYESCTPRENYLRRIWTSYINLSWELERLNNVNIYFSIDKIPEYYTQKGILNLEYYNYHYEYFRIKSVSILDYLVLFVNHCLQMGIPMKKCNIYSITENTNLKDSELAKSLNDFDKEISKLRIDRNKIIHEGTFEPESLRSLNDIIIEYEENCIHESDIAQGELKKDEIIKNIDQFNYEIKMINANVEIVLNCLIPHIKQQVNIFKLVE
jgi:hypothetical protein